MKRSPASRRRRRHLQHRGRIRSNKVLQRALKAWKRGDTIKTAKYSLEATDIDDSNALAFHLLAIALDRMGHLHQALVTYERAYELDPDIPILCSISA